MVEINKYQLIDSIVRQANDLAEAHGIQKCAIIVDMVRNLDTLAGMLKDDDGTHEEAVKKLTEEIDKLKAGGGDAKADTE